MHAHNNADTRVSTHTHTQTHRHTRARTHAYTHTLTRTHAYVCTRCAHDGLSQFFSVASDAPTLVEV